MKQFRKILAALLCALLVLGATTAFGAGDGFDYIFPDIEYNGEAALPPAETPADPNEDLGYINLLAKLGVGSADMSITPYHAMTRGEFASVCLKLGAIPYAQNTTDTATVFADMNTTHTYYSAVKRAVEMGILSLEEGQKIRPDAGLSTAEAAKMLLSAIGYGSICEQRGGFPQGYMIMAGTLGITKNVEAKDGLLRKEALRMAYQTLNVRWMEAGELTADGLVMKTGDQTVLNAAFEARTYKGVLDAVGPSSIFSTTDNQEGTLQIGGKAYADDTAGAAAWLGCTVTAYVSEQNDVKTVLYLEPNEENQIITMRISDIESADDSGATYFDENDKERKIRFASDAAMLYNKRHSPAFDPSKIKGYYVENGQKLPYTGVCDFIDNDGDSRTDIVRVRAYKTYAVGRTYGLLGMFSDFYDVKINAAAAPKYSYDEESLEGFNEVAFFKGDTKTDEAIKANSVISVATSDDYASNYMEIQICDQIVSGTVSKVTREGIVVADKTYELSGYYENAQMRAPEYAPTPGVNDKVILYLDFLGQICRVEQQAGTSGGEYAYLVNVGRQSFGSMQVRYINKDGEVKVGTMDEGIKLNGKSADPSQVSDYMKQNSITHAPVIMKADADGVIKSISFRELEYAGAMEYNNAGTFKGTGSNPVAKFRNKQITVGSNTVFLGVGFTKDNTVNTDYTVKMTNGMLEKRPGNNIASYINLIYFVDYDEINKTAGMIVVDSLPNTKFEDGVVPYSPIEERLSEYSPNSLTDSYSNSFFLVNEVSQGIDADDNPTYMVSGLLGGNEVSYVMRADAKMSAPPVTFDGAFTSPSANLIQWTPERIEGGRESNLYSKFPERFKTSANNPPAPQEGDIAAITFDKDGQISEYGYICSAKERPSHTFHERAVRSYMQWGFEFGPLEKIDGNTILITQTGKDGSVFDWAGQRNSEFVTSGKPTYAWDGKKQKFVKISQEELYPAMGKLDNYSPNPASLGDVFNDVWLFIGRQHWDPAEMVLIDYNRN